MYYLTHRSAHTTPPLPLPAMKLCCVKSYNSLLICVNSCCPSEGWLKCCNILLKDWRTQKLRECICYWFTNKKVALTYQEPLHSLHKTCSLPDVNVSHTLWHQPRPCVGAGECGVSLTLNVPSCRTARIHIGIGQFLVRFWLFDSFRFCSGFQGDALPTLDCLAEIRKVDVVHALGRRQSGNVQNAENQLGEHENFTCQLDCRREVCSAGRGLYQVI